MNSVIEILEHITKVCVRNEDGSLTLGTYEVGLLERALKLVSPPPELTYSPLCQEDLEAYDTKGQGGSGSNDDIF
jgi:hypothetical protein